MKNFVGVVALFFVVAGVDPVSAFSPLISQVSHSLTQRQMFGGAGAAAPKEDNQGEVQKMEQMAKSMGMSLEEYQIAMNARTRMEESINNIRAVGGDANKGISAEVDGNSPFKHLVVSITEEGKSLGKAAVEEAIVSALKAASANSKKDQETAQAEMMTFIGDSLKQ